MLAFLFLFLAVGTGFALTDKIRGLWAGRKAAALIAFPAAFTAGLIFSGWTAYIFAYLFRASGSPMAYGAAFAFAAMAAVCSAHIYLRREKILRSKLATFFFKPEAAGGKNTGAKKNRRPHKKNAGLIIIECLKQVSAPQWAAAVFFILTALFICWLMNRTFNISDGNINFGLSVFSDFAVHSALIRSFSVGGNFPTVFPHFPDGTMRYHFMFQFCAGMLEYLGFNIALAFNSISAASLFCACLALYAVAYELTGKRIVGALAVLFMFCRPSFSGIIYFLDGRPYESISAAFFSVRNNFDFIGRTPNEAWGLWNTNVYANQRHLAAGITVALAALYAMTPLMRETGKKIKPLKIFLAGFLFNKEAWLPQNIFRAVFVGIFLGASSFYNGAMVIAALTVLAVCAIFSKHRLEFLIAAVIAYGMSTAQAAFFGQGADIVNPQYFFGFISPDKTAAGVLKYIFELSGPGLIAAAIAIISNPRKFLPVFCVFVSPLVFTFTLSLTPDITVNHKYYFFSMMLINIFAAYGIAELFAGAGAKRFLGRSAYAWGAALLVLCLLTGAYDNAAMYHRNTADRYVTVPVTDEYQQWILNETGPRDVFLTFWHWIDRIYMTGRYEFLGWPYYAGSGGHDTTARKYIADAMFGAGSPDELRRLARVHGIDYIVLDRALLTSSDYSVNEEVIRAAFPLVYSSDHEVLYVFSCKR